MGLDQYGYSQAYPTRGEGEQTPPFQWRKHPQLHTWMENLWNERGNTQEFNCVALQLFENDLDNLEKAIRGIDGETLPHAEPGLFLGHQWQDETADRYRTQDLEFIAWAREELANSNAVFYDSWW